MPARSQSQQRMFAIAEHSPDKLNAANSGVLNMAKQQMHDFAATPRKGLPVHVKKPSIKLKKRARQ